jgi:hypothetical protein
MKTDITRSTFQRKKHYSGVRMQQGRVQLDADWNEQVDIQTHMDRITRRDTIGFTGTRQDDGGFEITVEAGGTSLSIGQGRYFVGGILCENEAKVPVSEQPDVPAFDLPSTNGFYLAYLDVWERNITALEDPTIREVALGGPDTATRAKTIWQVKMLELESGAKCSDYSEGWTPPDLASSGRLRAQAQASEESEDDCLVSAAAAYSRRENQLYRVEIHDGSEAAGGPTFKWSRDNSCILFRLELEEGKSIESTDITVSEAGQGKLQTLEPGQWVELSDEERVLCSEPGVLAELDKVQGAKLTVKSWPGGSPPPMETNPTVRRWDGTAAVTTGDYVELEDGVQVEFDTGEYRTGDYWMIPARTASQDVEWPADASGDPAFEPRHGTHHYCAPLAILERVSGDKWEVRSDCRRRFPALTDMINLSYISGDGQEAMPTPSAPLVPLGEPLRVGVTNGCWPVEGVHVKFEFVDVQGALSASPDYVVEATADHLIVATDEAGVAECQWELESTTPVQGVKAILLDDASQAVHLPVYFTANLSIASQIAYDSSGCLNPDHPDNVQDALTQLCHNAALFYVGGDGQEAMPGAWLPQPLQVRVALGRWPVKKAKVVFRVVEPSKGLLRAPGQEDHEITVETDSAGLAACEWQPDGDNPSQQVEAFLPEAEHLPIRLTANLSIASEVAYTEETPTVKEALDTLFKDKVNRTGDETMEGPLTIKSDLNVEGEAKAGKFVGDGSGLTNLPAGQWVVDEEGSIHYNKGNVGIGTEKPAVTLEVHSDDPGAPPFMGITSGENETARFIAITAGAKASDGDPLIVWRDGTTLRLGIANTGKGQNLSQKMVITPEGNVGIGTKSPEGRLDVSGGEVRWGNSSWLSADQGGSIELGGDGSTPGKGTPYIDFHFEGLTQDHNIRIINDADRRLSFMANTVHLVGDAGRLELNNRGIDCLEGGNLRLNYKSQRLVQVGSSVLSEGMMVYGDLHVTGSITADKDKGGYVTDRFINRSGDVLEQGDVVVLQGGAADVYYGLEDNIPVPEVDLTVTAYDHRACGIVSEILVEAEPTSSVTEEPAKGKRKTKSKSKSKSQAPQVHADGVKRLQVFAADELETLDRKKVGTGQIGKMVTLGCFAHCKVDADIAPIQVGDLLTTSPTKGHAQKVLEPSQALGAIIGKALGSLKKGKGKIPILVTLQ